MLLLLKGQKPRGIWDFEETYQTKIQVIAAGGSNAYRATKIVSVKETMKLSQGSYTR